MARAIDSEMKKSGADYVLLDITHKPARFIMDRFPNIYQTCLRYGIDITKEPIPVVPAAHYQCGGVVTNVNGQTDIRRALCRGRSGLHRLARREPPGQQFPAGSAGLRASRRRARGRNLPRPPNDFNIPLWQSGNAHNAGRTGGGFPQLGRNPPAACGTMWASCAPTNGCSGPRSRIANLQEEIHEYYWNFIVTSDLLELRNIATVAELIVALRPACGPKAGA